MGDMSGTRTEDFVSMVIVVLTVIQTCGSGPQICGMMEVK